MRTRLLAAGVTLLLLLTAGCSHPRDDVHVASAGGTATPSPTSTLSVDEQAVRWARCYRSHGVPMQDPQRLPDGRTRIGGGDYEKTISHDVLARADAACASLRPVLPAGEQNAKLAAARAESACIRQHGVPDYPDPDPDGHAELPDAVRQDPEFDAAKATCRDLTRSFTPKEREFSYVSHRTIRNTIDASGQRRRAGYLDLPARFQRRAELAAAA